MSKSGIELKEEGMRAALEAESIERWKRRFKASLGMRARRGEPFTSEDIIRAIGLPRGKVKSNANNAVGAMMNAAARKGIIVKTGRRVLAKRPTSHAAELTEWIGTPRTEG